MNVRNSLSPFYPRFVSPVLPSSKIGRMRSCLLAPRNCGKYNFDYLNFIRQQFSFNFILLMLSTYVYLFSFIVALYRSCKADGGIESAYSNIETPSTNENVDFGHCDRGHCPSQPLDRSNCDVNEAIEAVKLKRYVSSIPFPDSDPYSIELDVEEERKLRSVVDNRRINCGVRYVDEGRDSYELRTFPNEFETSEAGFVITHYGRCGACSSLKDLSVFLTFDKNLTIVAQQCSILALISNRLSSYCLHRIGLTETCVQIWLYSAVNTRRHCWWPCLKSWFISEPYNVGTDEKAELNSCLQCDEENSGLVFAYYAGRTRRNSGIVTSIIRHKDQVRNVKHCYY